MNKYINAVDFLEKDGLTAGILARVNDYADKFESLTATIADIESRVRAIEGIKTAAVASAQPIISEVAAMAQSAASATTQPG